MGFREGIGGLPYHAEEIYVAVVDRKVEEDNPSASIEPRVGLQVLEDGHAIVLRFG